MRTIVFLLFLSLYPFLSPGQFKIDLEFLCGPQTTFFQVEGEQNGLKTGPYWRDVTFAGRLYLHNGGPTRAYVGLSTYEMHLHQSYEGSVQSSSLRNWAEKEFNFGLHHYFPFPGQRFQSYLSSELGLAILNGDSLSTNDGFPFPQNVQYTLARSFDPKNYLGVHLRLGLGLAYRFSFGLELRAEASYRQGFVPMEEVHYSFQLPGANPQSGIFQSRGSGIDLRFGISYEISRIWEGKKELGAP